MDLSTLATKAEGLTTKAEGLAAKTASLGQKAQDVAATIETTAEMLSAQLDGAISSGALPPLPEPKVGPKAKPGYDHLIDALNRLPRPMIALTTVALFLVAAINPTWFEARMEALSAIPEPLWWLAGAVITLFFGSREAFYRRQTPPK
ncbi:holin family protein [Rhodobacter sp. KR11]|uniref:holin family protein n=1 Tax=Rhodobacter sp. KR11 TaxID=2974588 RepID=UPI0022217739|nr:holin family protein [Rhodobacter sp. KR11]MCW1917947.1 holin family protein [Rhodobacter sp. KR11]